MNGGIDHFRPDVDAQLANDKYPKTVSKKRQRNDKQRQRGSLPWPAQKKMSRHHTGDQQCHA